MYRQEKIFQIDVNNLPRHGVRIGHSGDEEFMDMRPAKKHACSNKKKQQVTGG